MNVYKVVLETTVEAESEAEAREGVLDVAQGWDCVDGMTGAVVVRVEDLGLASEGDEEGDDDDDEDDEDEPTVSAADKAAACTCFHDCRKDSHSGEWHQHEDDPCPVHPDATMVG